MVGHERDITEHQRAEEAFQRAKDELEQRVQQRTAELSQANERLLRELRERERAEAALRKSEEALRFQAYLLDAVDQAVMASDLGGTITYLNSFAERLYGWPAAEVVGRKILDIRPALISQTQAAEIMARLRTGQSWSGELLLQRRDGTTFPALVTDSPVYDDDGQLIGVVGISVDITERKRAEETERFLAKASAVLVSSLDYRETLSSLAHLAIPHIADWCVVDMVEEDGRVRPLAVAHVDPSKVELAWELERRYPFDPRRPYGVAVVLGTGQPQIYHEISDSMLAAVARDAEHLDMLQSVGLRSGMIVPLIARERMLGTISFGSAESGRRFGAADLQLAEDLAHRAALAIDNARLYQEAQAAIRTREEFLSIAAHELKTPVTALVGYSQVLRRRISPEKQVTERDMRGLQVIAEQAERLSKLISALLDVARLETGHFTLEREQIDLCTLARRVVEDIRPTLETHTIELICVDEPVNADGDALRLEQVLQNLLQNAIKYSPGGGVVAVTVEQRRDHATLAVADQGIGITQEARPSLFQRFYRARNKASSHVTGMGIGLYVVKEIVARHGGTVEVTSAEGEGSTFTVCLPLSSPSPPPGQYP